MTTESEFSDTKDWTWVLDRTCPQCGFDASNVHAGDVANLIRANAFQWRALLEAGPEELRNRPRPDTWSPLEYAFHVRDVFELYHHRLTLMLEQDGPHYPNWNQDETAVEKNYRAADPSVVSSELSEWAKKLATLFDTVSDDQWQRTGYRSDGAAFTIDSFARYLVHDPIHHLCDATIR